MTEFDLIFFLYRRRTILKILLKGHSHPASVAVVSLPLAVFFVSLLPSAQVHTQGSTGKQNVMCMSQVLNISH